MNALPPPDSGIKRKWCDSFTAQLLDLIADEPGISTLELADQLNQSNGRTSKQLARLRSAGQLTAMIPKMSNRPYRWTLADYSPLLVEPEPIAAMPQPEPIAAMPEPEPIADNHDEEASFSVAALYSAKLPKGLTEEDMEWHRYWSAKALQNPYLAVRMEMA
jgi:hypothetical protein